MDFSVFAKRTTKLVMSLIEVLLYVSARVECHGNQRESRTLFHCEVINIPTQNLQSMVRFWWIYNISFVKNLP